jgi:hypothetical protein
MKIKCKVTNKTFGKKDYFDEFILWNTKKFGDKTYEIREYFLSDLITFQYESLSSKVNYRDEFFICEDNFELTDSDDLDDYLTNINIDSKYLSYIEVCEDGFIEVYMYGLGRYLKLYDSNLTTPVPYKDLDSVFIKHGVIWIYDLEDILMKLS